MGTRARRLWEYVAGRREPVSTLLMGLAAVVTTWCAFESGVWGRIQAIRFNEAAAARVESTRNELAGNQTLQIDIATFLAWLEALQQERGPHAVGKGGGAYEPDPTSLSGVLFHRLRPEFRPAVEAWIATRPLVNEDAPPTPFAMAEYKRPLTERAQELSARAEQKAREGREANRNADNYLKTTVIASMVVFFAGMSAKLTLRLNGVLLLTLAWAAFTLCVVLLLRLPVVWSA